MIQVIFPKQNLQFEIQLGLLSNNIVNQPIFAKPRLLQAREQLQQIALTIYKYANTKPKQKRVVYCKTKPFNIDCEDFLVICMISEAVLLLSTSLAGRLYLKCGVGGTGKEPVCLLHEVPCNLLGSMCPACLNEGPEKQC